MSVWLGGVRFPVDHSEADALTKRRPLADPSTFLLSCSMVHHGEDTNLFFFSYPKASEQHDLPHDDREV